MSKKTRKKSSEPRDGRAKAESTGVKAKTAGSAKVRTTIATAAKKSVSLSPKKAVAPKAKAANRPSKAKTAASGPTVAALREGDMAPAFSLQRDGSQLVSLADYAGRKLVIFFYPRADTPGCTREAIAFSQLADAFAAAQTAVLGVSADPVKAQESFRDKHKLTVPLISDETLGMLTAYGVWGEKSMYGKVFMGTVRTTLLIDGDARILRIWRKVRVDGHAEEVLAAARAA